MTLTAGLIRASFGLLAAAAAATVLLPVEAHAASPGGDPWLRAQLVSARQLTGYSTATDQALAPSDIISGGGEAIQDLRDRAVRSARLRTFTSFDGMRSVRIRLVEFANHDFAAAFPQDGSPLPSSTLLAAPGGLVSALADSSGSARLVASLARGRVQALVLVTVAPAPGSSVPDRRATLALVSTVADLQYAALQDSPDLADSRTVFAFFDQVKRHLATILVGALLLFQGGLAVVSAVRDRSLWERLAGEACRPGAAAFDDAVLRIEDVSPEGRWRRRRNRLGALARIAVAVAVILAVVLGPGVSADGSAAILAIVLVAAGASAAELMVARLRQRYSLRAAYGGTAILASLLTTAATVVLACFAGMMLLAPLLSPILTVGSVPSQDVRQTLLLDASIGFAFLGIADVIYQLGRRLTLHGARAILQHDLRPEILLLRSFLDDGLTVRAHRSGRHALVERLTLRRFDRFEDILAWALWRSGPVVALGEPGTRLPPVGAAREFFPDTDWEAAVAARLRSSQVVVMIVGRTRSLVDEMVRIRHSGALGKTLFVFPPVPVRELATRLQVLSAALGLVPDCLSAAAGGIFPLTLHFDAGGVPVVTAGERRDDFTYQAAVDSSMRALSAQAGAWLASPIGSLRDERPVPAASVVVSPPRDLVRKRERRRRFRRAPWVGAVGLFLLNHVLLPADPGPPPAPGAVVATMRAAALAGADGGHLEAVDADSRALVDIGTNGRVRVLYRFPSIPEQVLVSGQTTYVSTVAPDRVVALLRGAAATTMAWSAPLDSLAGQLAQVGERIFVTEPAAARVVVLDERDGRVVASIPVAPGPRAVAVYRGEVIVGSVTDPALTWLDAASGRVELVQPFDGEPSSLYVDGDDLIVDSAEDGSVTRVAASTRQPVSRKAIGQVSGILAAADGRIAVGTYGATPRLVFLDGRTLSVVRSWPLPAPVTAMAPLGHWMLCSLPTSRLLTRVALT